MIKNERQLQLATAQIQKLERAIQEVENRMRPVGEHPRRKKQELNALLGQLAELSSEVHEYNALRSGVTQVGPIQDLGEIPQALIRQRIAKGLTHRELADRLGVAEQQIQRDEASDYVSASLDRLRKVARVLELHVDIPVAETLAPPTIKALTNNLVAAGFEKQFIQRRLESKIVQTQTTKDAAMPALDFAGRLARMFGWNPSTILAGGPLSLPSRSLAVAYKRPSKLSKRRLEVLSSYSEYCARLLIAGTEREISPFPFNATDVREQIQRLDSTLSFRAILEWAWSIGIVILPLNEPGGFHALVMRDASGRSVVVLKQRDNARWAFDLLHEIAHLARHPDGEFLHIDEDTPEKTWDDSEERDASRFAAEVLLGDKADAISNEAIEDAHGSLPRLKGTVIATAAKRRVPVGALALHTAFRLSQDGQSGFWGAAVNLAAAGNEDNRTLANDTLFKNLHWDRIDEIDRSILVQALSE